MFIFRFSTHYDIYTGLAKLNISDARLNDTGMYTVVAENKAGSDRTDGQLTVEKVAGVDETPIINPNAFAYLNRPEPIRKEEVPKAVPPKVIVPLGNANVEEGKPVFLACKIDGTPKPIVRKSYNTLYAHQNLLIISFCEVEMV